MLTFLYSCSPKLDQVEAPITTPESFSFTGTEILPDQWWTTFNEPILDTLVEDALFTNLNLASNWQEVKAALAVIKVEKSALWPQIGANAHAGISRTQYDFENNENLEIGLSASYELDLWGRIDAAVQAEEFRAQATFYDYKSIAMTVSAEVTLTWFRLLTAKEQLALIEDQIETNEDIIELIEARFATGQIRAVDILRQRQLLESTRRQKVIYETEIGLLKNDLDVLLGHPPQNEHNFPEASLPNIPPLPQTGLPLELIRRRPDVLQAYSLVLAADREMAQAIRSKYPVISINAGAQLLSNGFNAIFQDWAYQLAGNLVAPLLYGGRIKAEINQAEAIKQQRLYQYGQTVLNAFQEVENALIQDLNQKEQIALLQNQLELAQKTSKQLKLEFLNGLSNYLDVLLSLDEEQQLQRALINAKLDQLEARVQLYRALAGSFDTENNIELPE